MENHQFFMGKSTIYTLYPLVICYITIENGPVEIVNFPMKNGGSPLIPLFIHCISLNGELSTHGSTFVSPSGSDLLLVSTQDHQAGPRLLGVAA